MRQNVIVALLAVCATLLAVNTSRPRNDLPFALGQAAGVASGNYVIASGVNASGSNNVVYVFDTAQKRLAVYKVQARGIEFLGVRSVVSDMSIDWLKPNKPGASPDEIAKMIKKAREKKKR